MRDLPPCITPVYAYFGGASPHPHANFIGDFFNKRIFKLRFNKEKKALVRTLKLQQSKGRLFNLKKKLSFHSLLYLLPSLSKHIECS